MIVSELERKQDGRANSRFRGLNRISLLFPKRKPFIPTGNRGRSTETPFTTSNEDIILSGFGSRSTERPFTTPTTRPPVTTVDDETTTQNALLSLLRGRGRNSRPPFRPRVRTTRYAFLKSKNIWLLEAISLLGHPSIFWPGLLLKLQKYLEVHSPKLQQQLQNLLMTPQQSDHPMMKEYKIWPN